MNATQRANLRDAVAANLASMGAPELPEGHIYRIAADRNSDNVVRVEVRKLNPTLGSTRLSWATFSTRQGEPAVTAIVRACHEAYADAFPEGVPA